MDARDAYAVETIVISKHFGAVRAVDELSVKIPREGITSMASAMSGGQRRQRRIVNQ